METRFLAARSELGYVSNPFAAMVGEPQALSEDEQRQVTEVTRRRALDRRVAARQATIAEIQREIAYLDARGQYLRRQVKRLQRPV